MVFLDLSNLFEEFNIIITNRNNGHSNTKVVTKQKFSFKLVHMGGFSRDLFSATKPALSNINSIKEDRSFHFSLQQLKCAYATRQSSKEGHFVHRFSYFSFLCSHLKCNLSRPSTCANYLMRAIANTHISKSYGYTLAIFTCRCEIFDVCYLIVSCYISQNLITALAA